MWPSAWSRKTNMLIKKVWAPDSPKGNLGCYFNMIYVCLFFQFVILHEPTLEKQFLLMIEDSLLSSPFRGTGGFEFAIRLHSSLLHEVISQVPPDVSGETNLTPAFAGGRSNEAIACV